MKTDDIMALHAKAFTVATLLPTAELRAMRDAVEDAMCRGLSAAEFLARVSTAGAG